MQAYGSTPHIIHALKMLRMLRKGEQVKLPWPEAQQNAHAHIGHACCKGRIRSDKALHVVACWARHMGRTVAGLMVGVLIDEDGAHIGVR